MQFIQIINATLGSPPIVENVAPLKKYFPTKINLGGGGGTPNPPPEKKIQLIFSTNFFPKTFFGGDHPSSPPILF